MHDYDDQDHDGPRRLRYGQVIPIVSALQGLAKDGPTPEVRAQCAALSAVRVLMPAARDRPERQHAAYVDVLRALLRVPLEEWPLLARAMHTAACMLLDDAGELSEDEIDRYFPDTTTTTTTTTKETP
jgi:hypothetical protein